MARFPLRFDTISPHLTRWRTPAVLLMIMAAAMQFSFAAWWALIKNFAVDQGGFTGREIGIQESIREIPGFLAFLVVFILIFLREQTLAFLSLLILGIGVALTGYFPTIIGIYVTTMIMSIGFHYYETAAQSLQLQWLPKESAPATLGKIVATGAFAQLVAYGSILIAWWGFNVDFDMLFLLPGLATIAVVALIFFAFPRYRIGPRQHTKLILRKRYSLYYGLTFLSGGRRQIFTVFAGLLMVEKFDYAVHQIAALFLINGVASMIIAPWIGNLIPHSA